MNKYFFGMLLLFSAALSFTACKDGDDDTTPTAKNIVETAQATSDLSSLVAALQRADLVTTLNGAGPFTVFAPTNAAFAAFLQANGFSKLEDVPVATLKTILLNHVLSGEVKAAAVPTAGYVNSLATKIGATTNYPISLFAQKGTDVKINDAKVVTADVIASNGVVHIVDKVIAIPTIVNHALLNPEFSTLVAALTTPGLSANYVAILSDPAITSTVFAPTNAAFAALLTELGATKLSDIPVATLEQVLRYHVFLTGNVRSTDLVNGQQVTMLQGAKITIEKNASGVTLVDVKGHKAKVIIADVQAGNGVVHAIDKVVLPQ